MKFVPWTEERIEQLCQLWNRELGHSFPMRERLFRQNSFDDRNVFHAGSWIAMDEQDDCIIGFIVSKVWQERIDAIAFDPEAGWIQVLLVDSRFRNQGVGSELLVRAEQALKELGIRKLSLGNDFHWRYFPGIPEPNPTVKQWFERRGYRFIAETHDMFKVYGDETISPMPQFEGVVFRQLRRDDGTAIVDFMKRCFPGRWEYQILQYLQIGGTGREIVIAERAGKIIGFCRINDQQSPILAQNVYWDPLFEGELGGVGPLGIDPEYRGYGYGLAIVEAGIHHLRQRGIKNIVIDTTGWVDFYGKLEYIVWKSYSHYEKTID